MKRWTGLVLLALAGASCTTAQASPPLCSRTDAQVFILVAQAVPSATKLPCIAAVPAGWRFGGSAVQSDLVRLWLDSDVAGVHAVEVRLSAACDTRGAVDVPPAPGEAGTTVFQKPTSLRPFAGERFIVFVGGCLTTRYRFAPGSPSTLAFEADTALGLLERRSVVDRVRDDFGLTLCGADAPPCPS